MMEEVLLSRDKVAGISFSAIAIITSLAIMHGDTTLPYGFFRSFLAISMIPLLLALLCTCYSYNSSKNISALYLLICITLFEIVNSFYTYNNTLVPIDLRIVIALLCFCLMNNRSRLYAYNYYRFFLIICCFVGIIAYFCNFFSINIPHRVLPYYDNDNASYVDYGFAYISVYMFTYRLCGLFNEPGYLGTFCALYLISDNLRIKKIGNLILLVAGVLSLSLAFFVLVLLYYLLLSLKNKKTLLVSVFVILFLFFSMIYLAQSNPILEMLMKRFTIEDGEWLGDSRSSGYIDYLFDKLFVRGDYWWGYGSGFTKHIDPVGTSSYKGLLLDNGVLGSLLYLFPLIISVSTSFKKFNWGMIIFTICFFSSIYQRPFIITCNYMLALFGGLLNLKNNYKKEEYDKGRCYSSRFH